MKTVVLWTKAMFENNLINFLHHNTDNLLPYTYNLSYSIAMEPNNFSFAFLDEPRLIKPLKENLASGKWKTGLALYIEPLWCDHLGRTPVKGEGDKGIIP